MHLYDWILDRIEHVNSETSLCWCGRIPMGDPSALKDKRTRRVLCRSIRTWRATNVARRATTQTSVPVGTAMTMSCQLDQVLSNRSNNSRPNRIGWSGEYDGLTLLEARSMIPQECVGRTWELEQREPKETENPDAFIWLNIEYDWICE
jgi:hypothetical protein